MGSCSLLGCDVVDVGSRDAKAAVGCRPTTGALATLFNGRKVFGVCGIAEVEHTGGGDGVAEALKRASVRHEKQPGCSLRLSALARHSRTCLLQALLRRPNPRDIPMAVSAASLHTVDPRVDLPHP
jgi:hypothetical protein